MRTRLLVPAFLFIATITACGGGDTGGGGTVNEPDKGSISGRVVDTDSANGGVPNASLQVTPAGGAAQSVTTNASGNFQLTNLTPGAYTVQLTPGAGFLLAANESGTRAVTVTGGATAATGDIKLARPKGTVTGAVKTGTAAFPGVTVTLSRTGFTGRPATSGANGTFQLTDVPAGAWSLSVGVPASFELAAGEGGSRAVSVAAGQTADAPAFQLQQRAVSNTIDIHISGTSFVPQNLTVTAGQTVRWINDDAASHTVTPQTPTQPGVFARAAFSNSGVVLEHTFTTAGQIYRYRCELHSDNFTAGMVGSVTVQ